MPLSDFQPVIGLEVHAQLLTRSKIFCSCSTEFGAPPNHHTCPVCLGMPGVLPVLNRKVVEMAVRAGLALGCRINQRSIWSRKNYFYPDLPKGYQITQYDQPICGEGRLLIDSEGGEREIRVRRIHLEEDAGKNIHDAQSGLSLVDLNRAGVPLLELVSEPDLRGAEEAQEYVKALREILVYLGVNDGNLEEGSLRCDANVSVRRKGEAKLGTRTELKNLNSFRFLKQAIELEIARQVERIESGGEVEQETRLFDPQKGETRPLRSKEEAHDYRYFPEPDLPPLVLEDGLIERERKELPELPREKLRRFQSQYGLPAYDARILTSERPLADYFEAVAGRHGDYKKVSNWFLGELLRLLKEERTTVAELKLSPEKFAELLVQVAQGAISSSAAKEVFAEMVRTGQGPSAIIEEKGLAQVSDLAALQGAVSEVLAKNASEVEKYRAGKKQVFGYLMGQVMKAMQGKANPQVVSQLLREKLGG